MEKSFVFNSINGDRRYRAEDFRDYFASFVGNGVFPNPSTTLQVISNDDMTVTVKQGKGWINGAIYYNTENLILRVDNADGVLNRIDRVILRFDNLERNITCKIKKGVFSSTPVPKPLQRDMDAYELCLAEIYIGKGDTSVLQSKITDTRLNSDLCGIVTQVIKEIDTTELFKKLDGFIEERGKDVKYWMDQSTNKWEIDFNEWFDSVKGILDDDIAGALTNRILSLEGITKNHTKQIEDLKDILDNGLKAKNMLMSDGNSVEKNVADLRNKVNSGQNFKLTKDDGKYIEDTSSVNIDTFFFGWKNLYNINGTLPPGLNPTDNNVIIECKGSGSNFIRQMCYDVRSDKSWYRMRLSGVWKPWRSL